MKSKQIIKVNMSFNIPGSNTEYKRKLTWKDIIETEGIEPNDEFVEVRFIKKPESGFMNLDYNAENPKVYHIPQVRIIRTRKETDEEYEKRMNQEARREKAQEEKDKLEYFRLKAKFENN